MKVVLIGVFGSAGALARYFADQFVQSRIPGLFPWGTFLVNASGCFVLGVLFAVFTGRGIGSPALRSGLMVGFVGAYTTFSTFALDWVRMMDNGAAGLAWLYVGASVVTGLVFAFAGTRLGSVL